MKKRIAESFGRAAPRYDQAAHLQRHVGQRLWAYSRRYLPNKLSSQNWVLIDIGSGTGYFSQHIAKAYPYSQVYSCDIALAMMHYAQQHHPRPSIRYLAADFDALPFKKNSAQVIFSNLALQWSTHLATTFAELQRTLKPGGLLCCSIPKPGTLYELFSSWAAVDQHRHINRFPNQNELKGILTGQNWRTIWRQQHVHTTHYAELRDLLLELKRLGVQYHGPQQRKYLMGKKRYQLLHQHYETWRQKNGYLPARYLIDYLILENRKNSR